MHVAKFQIGQVVRHRMFPFRGVIFDVDPQFGNTAEYVAYVSEQNLLADESETPLTHPDILEWFTLTGRGTYELKKGVAN